MDTSCFSRIEGKAHLRLFRKSADEVSWNEDVLVLPKLLARFTHILSETMRRGSKNITLVAYLVYTALQAFCKMYKKQLIQRKQ